MTTEYQAVPILPEHQQSHADKQTKLKLLATLYTNASTINPASPTNDFLETYVNAADPHLVTLKKKLPKDQEQFSVSELFGTGSITTNKEDFLCGCEFEIECVENADQGNNILGVHVTTDGSLKYKGYEFITSPDSVKGQVDRYQKLRKRLVFDTGASVTPFNERTSTHVHVNVQLLKYSEVTMLLYLYIVVEQALFRMVHPSRRHNIHCVPLNFTCISKTLRNVQSIPNLVSAWAKYSALNLSPMKKLGTVEFRHMHGMEDVNGLEPWLRNLEALYKGSISGATPKDLIRDLYNKRTFTDIVKNYLPDFNLYGTTEAELALSGILLKQIVMGKI